MAAMTALPIDMDGYTVDDFEHLPDDDGLRHELVDGCLLVSPLPPNLHNHGANALGFLLRDALDPSWWVLSPGAVQLDRRNARGPDVLVMRREAPRAKYAHPRDVLLAVEVMSPSSVTTDRVTKPYQYAAAHPALLAARAARPGADHVHARR